MPHCSFKRCLCVYHFQYVAKLLSRKVCSIHIPRVCQNSRYSVYLPILYTIILKMLCHLINLRNAFSLLLIYFLSYQWIGTFFICLLAICDSFMNCLFTFFARFSLGMLAYSVLICKSLDPILMKSLNLQHSCQNCLWLQFSATLIVLISPTNDSEANEGVDLIDRA